MHLSHEAINNNEGSTYFGTLQRDLILKGCAGRDASQIQVTLAEIEQET